MHLAAALFHALVRHDGVFEAMAPGPRSKSARGRASR
jgi:cytochrome b561